MSKNSRTSSEISQAVKEIPTLIVEEIRRNEISARAHSDRHANREAPTLISQKKHARNIYQSPKNSRRWMFIGVVACTASIFGFWLLYISDLIQSSKSTINPTAVFTENGGEDISMLVNTFSKMESDLKNDLKSPAELKAMVANAILPLFLSSSTTSSTSLQTTSTKKE